MLGNCCKSSVIFRWKIFIALIVLLLFFTFLLTGFKSVTIYPFTPSHPPVHIFQDIVPVESLKIILFWTLHFAEDFIQAHRLLSGKIECGQLNHMCFVTSNKDLFPNSSAVIFHGGANDFMSTLPLARTMKRPLGQRWIYYNTEPPQYSPGPNDMKRWNSLFNWTMMYKLNSDIQYGYCDIIHNAKFNDGFDLQKTYLQGKIKTAIALISNCVDHRLELIKILGKYVDVDIYGNCGKVCKPYHSCFSLMSQYKFYLAFENYICKDYLTEKALINALGNEIVPVIVSGANLSNSAIIPPKSFINARNFDTAKDLADHLKHIGNQPQLYNEYFKWRDHWSIYPTGRNPTDFTCRVCEKLYEPNQHIKIYDDIASWHTEHDCEPYPVWN